MLVKIKFFAKFKERTGKDELSISAPDNLTLKEFLIYLKGHIPELEEVLSPISTMFSVNLEYASMDIILKDGDEIAFIPPVSGG